MLQVIIGGFLAILGGLAATWHQARNARKIRIGEILAEKEIEARRRAHNEIIRLRSDLLQCDNKQVLDRMDSDISWIVDLRPYLSSLFYDNWMSIRGSLKQATTLEDTLKDLEGPQQRTDLVNKLSKYKPHCEKLAYEALAELERVMGLKPKELKYPPESE